MSRPIRLEHSGAVWHVTSRGNEKRNIFRDDRDRLQFLKYLALAGKRNGWNILAYVLMTNHFHLVIETPVCRLSEGMHALNSAYAGWFNRKYKRVGHLFQGRFKGILVESDRYLNEVLRYTELNPVRARMVERPEEYRWSSYAAHAGLEAAPEWLSWVGCISSTPIRVGATRSIVSM